MKKGIITCLLVAAAFLTVTAQQARSIDAGKFQKSFAQNFPNASVNVWDTQNDFVVARFFLHDIKYDAWFTPDAGLYKVIKHTTIDELPISLSLAMKSKYNLDGSISAMEIVKPGGRISYITKFYFNYEFYTARIAPGGKITVLDKEPL